MRLRLACSPSDVEHSIAELIKLSRAFDKDGATPTAGPGDGADKIREFLARYVAAWETVRGRPPRLDYQDDWIVRQAFVKDLDAIVSRHTLPAFYCAQIAAFHRVTNSLAKDLLTIKDKEDAGHYVPGASSLMSDLSSRAIAFIEEFAEHAGAAIDRQILVGNIDHHRLMYRTSTCLWTGAQMQNVWAVILVLRQAIEIRIRHAVNVMGVRVKEQDKTVSLLEIIDALDHEPTVTCEVPWQIIRIIYRWANLYVHTGFQDYPWLAGFALMVLKPLMCGVQEDDGSWSVDNAIQISDEGLDKICTAIVDSRKQASGADEVRILSFPMKPRRKATWRTRGDDG